MRPRTYSQICQLAHQYLHPERAFWLMKDYVTKTLAHTKATCVKNMMEKFVRNRIPLREVKDLVANVVINMKSEKEKLKDTLILEKSIMRRKVVDSRKVFHETRVKMRNSKSNLSEMIREKTIARRHFMKIVNDEVTLVWNDENAKNALKFMKSWERVKSRNEVPDIVEGVNIGNDTIEEDDNRKEPFECLVFDNIELSESEKEILAMPPDHAIFADVNLEEVSTEIEKCIITSNWDKIRKDQEHQAQLVALESDQSYQPPSSSIGKLSLAQKRATDWEANKRVNIPVIDDEALVVHQTNLKKELLKVAEDFKNIHCTKRGKILKGKNISKKHEDAIKSLKQKEVAIYETDKTSRFVVDSLDNRK